MNTRKIIKVSSGLIMNDNFNDSFNPLWDFFPSNMNRVLFAKDSILLLPQKDEPLEMLIPTPNDGDFVMQTEVDYMPTKEGEMAGCLIKSITGNVAECVFSYEEDEQQQYRYIKLSSNKNYIVNLRASYDGVKWTDLGNTKFYDGNHIGYFVEGEESHLVIRNCILCKSKFITIHGVSENDTVRIEDENGTNLISKYNLDTKLSGDRFIVDLSHVLLPLKNVTIFIQSSVEQSTYTHIDEMYGGDIYKVNPDIEMTIESFNENTGVFDLGEVVGVEQINTLVLRNNSDRVKTGTIKIEPISSYETGHEMVYLAPLDSYNLNLKELEGVALIPGQDFKCLLKIKKETKYVTIDDDYRFSVVFI